MGGLSGSSRRKAVVKKRTNFKIADYNKILIFFQENKILFKNMRNKLDTNVLDIKKNSL